MKKLVITAGLILLTVGGLFFWNTWIFGWLNHGVAGYTGMSISELNVARQPYAPFFSVTELLSGWFLITSALGLIAAIRKGGFTLVVMLLIGMIGALTVFDATHPVDCNQYQNPVCVAKATTGRVSNTDKEHGIESVITNYATVSLALVLMAWALVRKKSGEDVVLTELVLVTLLVIGITASLVVRSRNLTFDSIAQRVWNSLVSFEFLYAAHEMRLYPRRRRVD